MTEFDVITEIKEDIKEIKQDIRSLLKFKWQMQERAMIAGVLSGFLGSIISGTIVFYITK